MLKEQHFTAWNDFVAFLAEFDKPPMPDGQTMALRRGAILFRGQAKAAWSIETTLERAGRRNCSFAGYEQLISNIKGEIETFTGLTWPDEKQSLFPDDVPTQVLDKFPHLKRWSGNRLANFGYMAYLRHLGFPSPLLDWTESPYIAAYFATAEMYDEPWAIYIYDERPRGIKVLSMGNRPEIAIITGRDAFQERHFRQQSAYTICLCHLDEWMYTSHDSVLNSLDRVDQDILVKCTFEPSM